MEDLVDKCLEIECKLLDIKIGFGDSLEKRKDSLAKFVLMLFLLPLNKSKRLKILDHGLLIF